MLTPVTEKKQIADLNDKLKKYLESSFIIKKEIKYRKYGSKKTFRDVSFSEKHKIWWYIGIYNKSDIAYWNCFGMYQQKDVKGLAETVEINMAKQGTYLKMAGLWAADGTDYFLLHSGKIGGGSTGIGQNAFLKGYTKAGNIKTIMINKKPKEYIVVLKLKENCIKQLATFIKDIKKIKDKIKEANK